MQRKLLEAAGAILPCLLLAGCLDAEPTGPALESNPALNELEAIEVWALSQGTDRLFVLDVRGTRVEEIDLPAGAGPHITTFTSDGATAFISGMGDGNLYVLDANRREIRQTVPLGPAGTHQARPAPGDALLLVAQIATRRLVKLELASDGAWAPAGELVLPSEAGRPICSIFRPDGLRAYASLLPSGLAVVDVTEMTLVEILPTDGFIACGMVPLRDGYEALVASSGSGGHIYRLSMEFDEFGLSTWHDELTSLGTVGAPDWHTFVLHADGRQGFGTAPQGDAVALVDVHQDTAGPAGILALDPTPGAGNDQPDRMTIHGNTLFIALRASGKLAIVELPRFEVRYLDLSPPAVFDPATCAGCALHGVSVRPRG